MSRAMKGGPEGAGSGISRWPRLLDPAAWLGPGLVMAATAIGASHLVLAPTAGARFGYALLWVLLLSHLFKYPGFEFGPRYAVARGRSLLDGYGRVPGPRNWALWLFLAGTVVQGVTVLAGVLGVASAVAAAAVPDLLPLWAWSGLLGAACATLLAGGGFDGLSALSKWMLLVLAAMTAVAFLATPPPPSAWRDLVVPAVPPEALVLVAAILGWMPTGLDVSVWHSMWALERREAWAERAGAAGDDGPPPRDGRDSGAVLRVGLLDMRIGYGLSLVLSIMFLALGAEVLAPTGAVPEGGEVAVTLARLYTAWVRGSIPSSSWRPSSECTPAPTGCWTGFPGPSRRRSRLWPATPRARGRPGEGGGAKLASGPGPRTGHSSGPAWSWPWWRAHSCRIRCSW